MNQTNASHPDRKRHNILAALALTAVALTPVAVLAQAASFIQPTKTNKNV